MSPLFVQTPIVNIGWSPKAKIGSSGSDAWQRRKTKFWHAMLRRPRAAAALDRPFFDGSSVSQGIEAHSRWNWTLR